jgi:hypothetical protein
MTSVVVVPGVGFCTPVARRVSGRDLSRVHRQLGGAAPPRCRERELAAALDADVAVGWVVEVGGRVRGVAVCRVIPRGALDGGVFRRLARRWCGSAAKPTRAHVEAHLLDLRVADGGLAWAVEQALLECLEQDLRQSAARVELVVPERLLAAQLYLRTAGYRAVEILHGFYESEDGYRMVGPND